MLTDILFLKPNTLILQVEHLICLLRPEVWLVVQLLDVVRMRLAIAIRLDLFGQELHILHIVLLFQLCFVHCDQILLLLLPVELLTLEFPRVLDLLALLLEALVRQVVDLLDVVYVLLSFVLGVVVDLERTLRPHEVWVSLRVVVGRDLLAIEGQTYYRPHVILSVMHSLLYELIQTLLFAIQIVCGLVKPVHVFLALRNVTGRLIICGYHFAR